MIIFDTTLENLIKNKDNVQFYKNIETNYKEKLKRNPSAGEFTSWINSVRDLAQNISTFGSKMNSGVHVLIEYSIPLLNSRIDVVFTGKDVKGDDSVVIIELKQWTNVGPSKRPGYVKTNVANTFEQLHPILQVKGYKNDLLQMNQNFEESNIDIIPLVYMHNYLPRKDKDPIIDHNYSNKKEDKQIFTQADSQMLVEVLFKKVGYGKSEIATEILREFKYAPSKTLVGNAEVHNKKLDLALGNLKLLQLQRTFFELINMELSSGDKKLFIIKGNAGTGKSVMALKFYLEYSLIQENKLKTALVLPGTDFRNSVKGLLGIDKPDAKRIFNSVIPAPTFTSQKNHIKKNEYELIIVDESHKLQPNPSMGDAHQINEILSKSDYVILFYDKNQITDFSSYKMFEDIFEEKDTVEYDLSAQFRSGNGNYIEWLHSKLFTNKDIHLNDKMIFANFDSDVDFISRFKEDAQKNKRLLATNTSFGWTINFDGKIPFRDLEIANDKFAWYPSMKSYAKRFVGVPKTLKSKFTFDYNLDHDIANGFVGYYNTVQGHEFTNTYIYVGNEYFLNEYGLIDFNLELAKKKVGRNLSCFRVDDGDSSKRMINRKVALNQLYILLTRGTDSVNVYFEDKKLRDYFNNES